MTIKDFNLLELDVYDGDNLVYNGMCEDVPDELKNVQVKIDEIDGKKLIIHIVKEEA